MDQLSRQPASRRDDAVALRAEETSLARSLAPEEVRVGDFVAVLHMVYEVPSFMWCLDPLLASPQELIRLQCVPEEGGIPLKVLSVCLPFVLVRSPCGKKRPIDVRRCRLARLGAKYAAQAWKAQEKQRHPSK